MTKKFKNKDLAAKLGVSGTLVSLVLNNKADQHGIRKDTQEKVLALARQMGYFNTVTDKNIIVPVEETPGIIGMIVPSQNDPFVVGITPYLQKAFSSIGFGFSVIAKDPDDRRFDRMIVAFKKFFSGIILVGEAADEVTIRALRVSDFPFVTLEKQFKTSRLNAVCTDLFAGVQILTNHIHKMGYTNIIIAAGSKKQPEDIKVIDMLQSAIVGIPELNKPVIVEMEVPDSESDINFQHLDPFLRPPYRADIIIAIHAYMVYPLMRLLKKRKLRVPQDIALISMEEGIGFDLLFSPVTSLKRPLTGMAIKVANMVWTEIKNSGKGKYKRQVNMPPELVIRNSSGTIS